MKRQSLSAILTVCVGMITTTVPQTASACGGFFCTTVPINQAAEQIVFRQQGGDVTAMVRILYAGNAEDFSWVVPVPDTPELSIGSDATFNDLGFATQPNFRLEQEGQVCPEDQVVIVASAADSGAGAPESDGGVVIEEQLELGPFDIDVVSSDNADDMANWLSENGYLLTDRGGELLAPYIADGMKFVALKLRSGESAGSIQPLIMKYPSEKPMVPIRLTAIAAEDDMGVVVWVVNDQLGRAIPENYEHVIPNYTKLDWFNGPLNAYGSYQALITDAMNESGGQGFATDFAGTITSNLSSSLTSPDVVVGNLATLDAITRDAAFISEAMFITTNPAGALAAIGSILPVPAGQNSNLYFDPDLMEAIYNPTELREARTGLRTWIVERELEPLQDSVGLLPEGAYLTRLYTTLSADEMTVDPTFNYNPTMPDQSSTRTAKLNASCTNDVSNWTLTLGSGTGRDGETVLDVTGQPIPGFGLPAPTPVDEQPAAFERQRTSAEADPVTIFQASIPPLVIDGDGNVLATDLPDSSNGSGSSSSSSGFLGASGPAGLLGLMGLLLLARRRG